ncbi:MAG: patatin-like phospholipase family protein [Anaerolineales bacterium]|nr:patatin-like phospholipase family protein [Anaerolineales bacterium]
MEYDLVFEGGGAKGIVFVGAMQEFEARGHTVGRIMGTSAGAITATLLAAGYSAKQMLEVINERLPGPEKKPRFSTFMDVPPRFDQDHVDNSLIYLLFSGIDIPLIADSLEAQIDAKIMKKLLEYPSFRQLFSFVERGGLYSGDLFLFWFREKLNAGGRVLGNTTLKQFHEQTGKDLTVMASDTSGQELLVLNHRTAPNLPTAWAVRMSMSIPFVWQEVIWLKEWGLYRGRDITGHWIVDGGALSNFPIDHFLDDTLEIREVMGPDKGSGNVVGFLIDDTIPVPNLPAKPGTEKAKTELDKRWFIVLDRVNNLINTITQAHDKSTMLAYKNNVCHLPAKGVGTVEFDMTNDRINTLMAGGLNAAREYFNGLNRLARPRPSSGR